MFAASLLQLSTESLSLKDPCCEKSVSGGFLLRCYSATPAKMILHSFDVAVFYSILLSFYCVTLHVVYVLTSAAAQIGPLGQMIRELTAMCVCGLSDILGRVSASIL